jgi:hypothetical protein
MSNDRRRLPPPRRRVLVQVEGLEDRSLLSGAASHHVVPQSYRIETPGKYVSQDVGALDVTIDRSAWNGRHYLLKVASTVNFSATLGSTTPGGKSSSPVASAGDPLTPVYESITFPVGVATETVHIPVNSGAANPGSVPVELSVTSLSAGLRRMLPSGVFASAVVYLVSGPAALPATPPGITSAHLIVQGATASGIAITFSRPMALASVEDVHNYAVLKAGPTVTGWDTLPWVRVKEPTSLPVALKGAQYDPTTNTVTLFPKSPLKTSALYTIRSPYPLTQSQTLTDPQGTPLQGNVDAGAAFLFQLKGAPSLNWAAPQPAALVSGP